MEDLKKQVIADLNKNNEQERLKRVEENSKLKEITLYTKENNPLCETYKKFFSENGIKFNEKDINEHKKVISTVMIPNVPIIEVNDTYLVVGRDFNNAQQCAGALKHFADPDYIAPSLEVQTLESIKNLNAQLNKLFQNLNRQMMPISKIMNELVQEERKEQAENAKKNK